MRPDSLTSIAHNQLLPHLFEGAFVIDATAGNGFDTTFLAERVGERGKVFAFDVQSQAIEATRKRLDQAGLIGRVELIKASHHRFDDYLPAELRGKISAAVYNLGYLPRGDKSVTTQIETTIASLGQALEWLAPGGIISILAYTSHPGGEEEADAIEQWLSEAPGVDVVRINPDSPSSSPRLIKVVKA